MESQHSGFDSGDEDEYIRECNNISPPAINYIDILQQDSCESVLDSCISRQHLPNTTLKIPEDINVERLHAVLEDMSGSMYIPSKSDLEAEEQEQAGGEKVPVYSNQKHCDETPQLLFMAAQDVGWRPLKKRMIKPPKQYANFNEISRFFMLNYKQHLMFIQAAIAWGRGVCKSHDTVDAELKPPFNTGEQQFFGYLNGAYVNYLIIFSAGYGKSEVVLALLYLAKNWKLPETIATTSYNGIAAVNVSGITMCSMFGWNFRANDANSAQNRTQSARERFAPLILLIVDEISTIKQHNAGMLDQSLQDVKDRQHVAAGGLNLLFIGITSLSNVCRR
jgi:hypothetical protein